MRASELAADARPMEESIATLLESYGFELTAGETPYATAARWLAASEADWVRLAVLEALHQGRYKAISVEQILLAWQRRGKPVYHFTPEFERFICHNPPQRHTPAISASPLPPPLDCPPASLSGEIVSFSPLPNASELLAKLQEAARQEAADRDAGERADQPLKSDDGDESDDSDPLAAN